MTIRRSLSILLALAVVGALATTAQKPAPTSAARISLTELEKAAQVPSLEQLILRAAAAKLREGKQTQASSVEVQVTIRPSLRPPPRGCEICASGPNPPCFRTTSCDTL
ncbi:MAG TPA: hypothetical protein VHB47_19725 [Thermoanaerobaculia bacterium]|nr:hypothetical protein [Thermoanaerobaculia bacterium]